MHLYPFSSELFTNQTGNRVYFPLPMSSPIPCRPRMVRRVTPISESEDALEQVRNWSPMRSTWKTMFGGKKTLPRSSSSEKIHLNHGTEGALGDGALLRTTDSINSSFSDALTMPHEEVPNTDLDTSISGISEAASDEVESALSDCARSPTSAMLLAFASVQSWGRSAGEKGTDHYGAGYHTRNAAVCKM